MSLHLPKLRFTLSSWFDVHYLLAYGRFSSHTLLEMGLDTSTKTLLQASGFIYEVIFTGFESLFLSSRFLCHRNLSVFILCLLFRMFFALPLNNIYSFITSNIFVSFQLHYCLASIFPWHKFRGEIVEWVFLSRMFMERNAD